MKVPIYNGRNRDLIGIADIEEVALKNIATFIENGCPVEINMNLTGNLVIPYELCIINMPFVSKYKHEKTVEKECKKAAEETNNSIDGLSMED
jgi:hypothetical protein